VTATAESPPKKMTRTRIHAKQLVIILDEEACKTMAMTAFEPSESASIASWTSFMAYNKGKINANPHRPVATPVYKMPRGASVFGAVVSSARCALAS